MPDANVNVDVYCQMIERVGNSLIFTLEIDDLPDIDEAEKVARDRLSVGGKKVTVWDVGGVMAYINAANKARKAKK